jgi:Na+/melibiose symporter-like transporter
MNTNDLVAMVLLIMAVTDTICIQFFWPKMAQKMPEIKPEQVKNITKMMNLVTVVCAVAAIAIYIIRPL